MGRRRQDIRPWNNFALIRAARLAHWPRWDINLSWEGAYPTNIRIYIFSFFLLLRSYFHCGNLDYQSTVVIGVLWALWARFGNCGRLGIFIYSSIMAPLGEGVLWARFFVYCGRVLGAFWQLWVLLLFFGLFQAWGGGGARACEHWQFFLYIPLKYLLERTLNILFSTYRYAWFWQFWSTLFCQIHDMTLQNFIAF